MYFAFNNDFLNQWYDPLYAEKKRKEIEETKKNQIMKLNMENLENCIKLHSIEELDRTKPYDKTFVCDKFINSYGRAYIFDLKEDTKQEMEKIIEVAKPLVNKLGITHKTTNNYTSEINTTALTHVKEYTFMSNIIPKNAFTNIGTFFVFRISNITNTVDSNINIMKHKTQIPYQDTII